MFPPRFVPAFAGTTLPPPGCGRVPQVARFILLLGAPARSFYWIALILFIAASILRRSFASEEESGIPLRLRCEGATLRERHASELARLFAGGGVGADRLTPFFFGGRKLHPRGKRVAVPPPIK
jgi:hypothetical protein